MSNENKLSPKEIFMLMCEQSGRSLETVDPAEIRVILNFLEASDAGMKIYRGQENLLDFISRKSKSSASQVINGQIGLREDFCGALATYFGLTGGLLMSMMEPFLSHMVGVPYQRKSGKQNNRD